jgi:hypothetical protein
MKPIWVFGDFKRNDDDIKAIKQYLIDNDYKVITLGNVYEYNKNELIDVPLNCACVVIATISLCEVLHKDYPGWVPGVIGHNNPKYDCKNYYASLKDFILNQKYEITTVANFRQTHKEIFDTYAIDDCIFTRPCDNDKSFTGKLLMWEHFHTDIETLAVDNNDNLEIVVAEPITILGEYRFVICGGKPITASMYRMCDQSIRSIDIPNEAWDLAERVASEFNPDPVWILDICQAKFDKNWYVLEIGQFSGSGLYLCDPKKIVDNVSAIAEHEYRTVSL